MEVERGALGTGVEPREHFGVDLRERVLVRGFLQAGDSGLKDGIGAVGVLEIVDGEVDHFEPGADFVRMGGGDYFVFGEGFLELALGAAGLGDAVHGLGLGVIFSRPEQAAHGLRQPLGDGPRDENGRDEEEEKPEQHLGGVPGAEQDADAQGQGDRRGQEALEDDGENGAHIREPSHGGQP